ncbi:MAG TPA: type II toxin-antitoxin system Phd/YefM family antitoxin [Myxococcota bacterium]|nr:type II toxin-antitoxin system Phd/YefM family antitoxin [Myxococcota bacterium]
MAKTRPSQDIRSLSDFRANVAAAVRQVRRKGRPIFLTQHGRGAAVLLDVSQYEALVDELELLRDIHTAENQLSAGRGIAHTKARSKVLSSLRGS